MRPNPAQLGERFGRGVVINTLTRIPRSSGTRQGATLRCDCGTEYQATMGNLRSGNTQSCGCLHREKSTTHGLRSHPLASTWHGMLHRCENPDHAAYPDYGGRGITVCEAWHDLPTFIADIDFILGPRPAGMSLDRIDNDGPYAPDNVRWADKRTQSINQRHFGLTPAQRAERDTKVLALHLAGHSAPEIAGHLGVSKDVAHLAIKRVCQLHNHTRTPQTAAA